METVILPQRAKRLTRAQRRAQVVATTAPIPASVIVNPAVGTVVVSKKKRNRNRRNRRARRNQTNNISAASRERAFFKAHLLAPDVFGPFRQPRAGGSDRTGLGYDQTDYAIVGSGTNFYQGVQAASTYLTNSAVSYAVATSGTALGAGSNVALGLQFPAQSQVADVNMTACSILVYYIGNPLNVQGEVLIGSTIPIAASATYSSLYFYPGVLKIPVAELINRPMRVSMRKLSPIADEFVTVASGNQDVDLPFILAANLPTGGTLQCVITRSWEYRSTTAAGSVIPYERVGPSHSTDLLSFTDAKGDIADMSTPLTPALPEMASSSLSDLLGLGSGLVGTATAVAFAGKKILGSLAGGARSANMNGLPFDAYV